MSKAEDFVLQGRVGQSFPLAEARKISQDEFILGESTDKTQKIRFRRSKDYTLLSLDIRFADEVSVIPALTVLQDKGKLQVSFNMVSRDHELSRSMSYSSPEGLLSIHINRLGYTLNEADLLLTRGAFPETEVSEDLREINVEATTENILKKFASLTQALGGFEAVTVPELVRELFVGK